MAKTDKDLELARLTGELKRSFDHWDHLYNYGGQDPFYPDGTNLNLVRNHIISEKKSIDSLVSEESAEMSFFTQSHPDIYYRETPEKVADNYMARADEIRARAQQQLALYENDANFMFCLENHDKVFPKGETKATKEAGLSVWKSTGLSRYRKCIEADDLVSMRRNFYTPYEEKAPGWAEAAKELKRFLEMEHDPKDNVAIESEFADDEDYVDEDFELEEEETPSEKPAKKPSLNDKIRSAAAKAASQEQNTVSREEQLSLF